MRALWVPMVQLLRYRMKGDSELRVIEVTSLDVTATPTAWNAEGKPTAWHVELFVNGWHTFPVHDLTDWHVFETMPAAQWRAENGEPGMPE